MQSENRIVVFGATGGQITTTAPGDQISDSHRVSPFVSANVRDAAGPRRELQLRAGGALGRLLVLNWLVVATCGDRNLARFHRVRDLPHQIDLEHTVLE